MGEDIRAESHAFDDMLSLARADDPLALFEAEPASVAAAVEPPAPSPVNEQTLPLSDVLERLHYVSWAEGVSIVDGLCTRLTAATGTGERVPELRQISITSHGTVVVASGAAKGPAGPRLARILHALTANGPVPAPLRLFVSKWVACEGAHTIAEFTKELSYFVRPAPAALIQAVYERATAARLDSPAQTAPQPAQAVRPREEAQSADRRRRMRRLAGAGIVLAALVVAALTWRAVSNGSTTASAGEERTDTTSVPARPSSGAGVVSNRSANRAAARRVSPGSPRPSSVTVREPLARTPTGTTLSAPPAVRDVPLPAVAPRRSLEDARESPIYSSADPGVTPPQTRQPQLPPPFLSGVQVDVNTIELIVTEAGTVERVRLLSPPKRMSDMMLLSGAKTWRFEPASRDGQSVRYRLLLSWDATP